MSLYRHPICPAVNCTGQLIVDFDDHADPTALFVICKSCGHVVSALYAVLPRKARTIPATAKVASY
jgi:hypothetical protein